MLAYKAESAGRQLVRVDPRGSSQRCPCGKPAHKKLSNGLSEHSASQAFYMQIFDRNELIDWQQRFPATTHAESRAVDA